MGYGQHQSFYLRDRWLNKAIKHLQRDNRFFYDKEAFEKMGLGKNMVQSLRYWVVATGVVSEDYNEERKKIYEITPFGNIVFKYDKFIKFQDTASIIHYHMCKESEPSTAWFWFFNILNETIISKDELLEKFIAWVKENEEKEISTNSLKKDIECLVKLYSAKQENIDPEEVIQSPLNKLSLVSEKRGMVYKKSLSSKEVGLTALMYVLLDFRRRFEIENITVDELVTHEGLWGRVFNMARSTIVDALEQLSHHLKYPVKFTRTNNLDTIRIPEADPLEFLFDEYVRKVEKCNGVKN
ncbi:DUF4007 family protein [Ectobacillus panaciterrae]|uniref:DUF4007 family protein n=1 Tax=Ectobacillus panaciterrae TaxID=363872 RepID=UPI0003F60F9C|nr:DUF4007 family protein [Ectobacillus panaciterrae]